ncbi:hypothetical protein ABZ782_03825 [Streptomyces asoensis]|uniref:hypothetical protein n=1 Tax=Streptomyces asoensis TaxID=249586 RepID=UPI0033DE5ABE
MYASSTPALLVGPCATPADVDDLRAYGFDVCDQMGLSVVVATSDDVDVRDFSAVYVYEPTGRVAPVAALLEGEAYLHGVPVVRQQSVFQAAACDACAQVQTIATVRNEYGEVFCVDCRGLAAGCAHCGDDTVTRPVDVDGAWAPICRPCVEVAERATGRTYAETVA